MVSHDEMFDRLIKRREEYLEAKKRRRAVIQKSVLAASGLCAVLALGFGVFTNSQLHSDKENNFSVEITEIPESTETTAFTENAEYTDITTKVPQNPVTAVPEYTSADNSVTLPVTSVYQQSSAYVSSSAKQPSVSEPEVTDSPKTEGSVTAEKPLTTTESIIKEESNTERPSVSELNPSETQPSTDVKEEIDMKKHYQKTLAVLSSLILTASAGQVVFPAYADVPSEPDTLLGMYEKMEAESDALDFNGDGVFDADDEYALYVYKNAPEYLPEGYAERIEKNADVFIDGQINTADMQLIEFYGENVRGDFSVPESYPYGPAELQEAFCDFYSKTSGRVIGFINFVREKPYRDMCEKAQNGELDLDMNGDGKVDLKDAYAVFAYSNYFVNDIETYYVPTEMTDAEKNLIGEKADIVSDVLGYNEEESRGYDNKYQFVADNVQSYIVRYTDITAEELNKETYKDIYSFTYPSKVMTADPSDEYETLVQYYVYLKDNPDEMMPIDTYPMETRFLLSVIREMEEESSFRELNKAKLVSSGDMVFLVSEEYAVFWRYYGESEDVEIPAEINGKPVTVIDEGAFCFNNYIRNVIIPDSVQVLESAFYGCKNLSYVKFPKNITEIEESTFRFCDSLKSIDLPDSLVKIGDGAFYSSGLESITIPDNVTSIGYGTFCNCFKLTDVILPKNLTRIETDAFSYCGFTSVELPDTLEKIGYNAFWSFDLKELTIPASVKELGDRFVSDSVKLYGYSGSAAEKYAADHNIAFTAVGEFWNSASVHSAGILTGDVDNSGIVDLSDLTELSAYLLKDKDFSENQLKAADTNHDEEVTVSDLARLKQYITNEITEL